MSSDDLVRAWKDPDGNDSHHADHPAGEISLGRHGGGATGMVTVLCTVTLDVWCQSTGPILCPQPWPVPVIV